MKKRQRCPFCRHLITELREHIIEAHFPMACTLCGDPPSLHKKSDSSPVYTIPCPNAEFVTLEPR